MVIIYVLSLLTTITSYATSIHNVNKEYHNTYIYRYTCDVIREALYMNAVMMYNWRSKTMTGTCIFNKFDALKYMLPDNY